MAEIDGVVPEDYNPKNVTPPVFRLFMGTQAVMSLYMILALAYYVSPLSDITLGGWIIHLFMTLWGISLVTGVLAAWKGWDILIRVAAGASATIYWGSLASILTDSLPFVQQFYTMGASIVLALCSTYILMLPPLDLDEDSLRPSE